MGTESVVGAVRRRWRTTADGREPSQTSWIGRYGLVAILVAIVVGFSLLRPETFATWNNLRSILENQAVVVVLALAAMIPLIAGEFDVSVASILGVAQALTTGLCALQGLPVAVAVVAALLVSVLLGVANGLIVVRLQVNAFVATLASGTVMGGLVVWYSSGKTIYDGVPAGLTDLTRGSVLGIPSIVLYVALVVAAFWFVLARLPLGRRLYAVGGNRRAAEFSGIRSERLVIGSFAASGLVAGLAGVLLGSQLGSAVPGNEGSYMLPAFAGAFLGATAIHPGRFNPLGTVVAVYALSVAISGLQQVGAPSWVTPLFNGTVLITAVALSGHAARLKLSRARRRQLERLFEGPAPAAPLDSAERTAPVPPAPSAGTAPTAPEPNETRTS